MSGLFTRLAQLHINQRAPGVKPVKSPVFPLDINEHGVDASSVGRQQMPSNQSFEANRQVKSVDETLSATTVLNSPRVTPEESSLAQSPSSGLSDLSPIFIGAEKHTSLPDVDVFDSLPDKSNSLTKQPSNNHQLHSTSIRNRNARSSKRIVDSAQGENQATVNISIGQIDIRATKPEQSEKKSSVRPNRTRPNALEEYHQKRLRGER